MQEESFLNSTSLWYSVSLLTFIGLFIWKGWKPFLALLDSGIESVRAELEEAKRLHEEAAATLQDYKLRQQDAMQEASRIIEQAQKDALRLREEAEANLKAEMQRQEALAHTRIKMAQDKAIHDVRSYVIDEALRDVQGKISKIQHGAEADKLVDSIIADLSKLKTG